MSSSVKVDFAATTGVQSGESVVKALLAGASVVQIASVLYKSGMDSVGELNNFVLNWMKEKGYKSISDFKGKLSYKSISNPAAWERVQFMREFRHFVK
jgi:dihydroorotate dehydrogenase (fumarate)